MTDVRAGLLRALAFHYAWGYAPTRIEWIASWDAGSKPTSSQATWQDMDRAIDELVMEEKAVTSRGRYVFPGEEHWIAEHEAREAFFPHKIRRARRVTSWLHRLEGVRWVGLCNTTALANAREDGDLDFFVITKTGSLWQTRGAAAFPFKLLGARPGGRGGDQDAVCLSFFVDDSALDLTPLQITPDDPYFRHWFLSLLPLFDDGIGEDFWQANKTITDRHPFAERWLPHLTIAKPTPRIRLPVLPFLESTAINSQRRLLPRVIHEMANDGTHVVVTDQVLKLHTTDGREAYRQAYYERCQACEVEP